jgi:hypothetical protein
MFSDFWGVCRSSHKSAFFAHSAFTGRHVKSGCATPLICLWRTFCGPEVRRVHSGKIIHSLYGIIVPRVSCRWSGGPPGHLGGTLNVPSGLTTRGGGSWGLLAPFGCEWRDVIYIRVIYMVFNYHKRVQKGCVSIQPLTDKSPYYALGSNVIKNRKTSHTLEFWTLKNCRFRFVERTTLSWGRRKFG